MSWRVAEFATLVDQSSAVEAMEQYDAFISYSHQADAANAKALRSALHSVAKPWYRVRTIRAFLDSSSLSATPALSVSLEGALNGSRWLVLLACPSAAKSEWVQRELQWWLSHKSADRILVVLTSGSIQWRSPAGDFDWIKTTAIPPILSKKFLHEPLWIDLRSDATPAVNARGPRLQAAVLDLAAAILDKPRDQLDGEDQRIYRANRLWARSAVASLVILFFLALAGFVQARRERDVQKALVVQLQVENARRRLLDGDAEFVDDDSQAPVSVSKTNVVADVITTIARSLQPIATDVVDEAGNCIGFSSDARWAVVSNLFGDPNSRVGSTVIDLQHPDEADHLGSDLVSASCNDSDAYPISPQGWLLALDQQRRALQAMQLPDGGVYPLPEFDPTRRVERANFNLQGNMFIVVFEDEGVEVRDGLSRRLIANFPHAIDAAFSPDGSELIALDRYGKPIIYKADALGSKRGRRAPQTPKTNPFRSLVADGETDEGLAGPRVLFDSDPTRFSVVEGDATSRLYSASQSYSFADLNALQLTVAFTAAHNLSNQVLVVGDDLLVEGSSALVVRGVTTGRQMASLSLPGQVQNLVASHDGRWVGATIRYAGPPQASTAFLYRFDAGPQLLTTRADSARWFGTNRVAIRRRKRVRAFGVLPGVSSIDAAGVEMLQAASAAPQSLTVVNGSCAEILKAGKSSRSFCSETGGTIVAASLAPNERRLAVWDSLGTVSVWDADAGELLSTVRPNKEPDSETRWMGFDSSSSFLLTSSGDHGGDELWNLSNLALGPVARTGRTVFREHLAFGEKGDTLVRILMESSANGSTETRLRRSVPIKTIEKLQPLGPGEFPDWDAVGSEREDERATDDDWALADHLGPRGLLVDTNDTERSILVTAPEEDEPLVTLNRVDPETVVRDVSADRSLVIVGLSGGKCRILDAKSGDPLWEMDSGGEELEQCDFDPSGKMVLTRSVSGTVAVWKVRSN
ncbi:MAG: toll/interleukin-1 receptor domain-containing protein [Vicinamibacterales bacterium]